MPGPLIRNYKNQDRSAVRKIAFDTALMGESADNIFEDSEIFSDFLTLYYSDHEPESCFVAESNNEVIGYLLGSKNAHRAAVIFAKKILPYLLLKALRRGTFLKKKNALFLFKLFVSLVKGEFRQPDPSKVYPATLHINIAKGYRDLGIGSNLVDAFVGYLKKEGVPGLYAPTMSDRAGEFFVKNGFALLHKAKRTYLKVLGKDITVYCYARPIK